MIRSLITAAALAGGLAAMPAAAQSVGDDARFQAAQQRFDRELAIFRQAFDRYRAAQANGPARYDPDGGQPPYDPRYDTGGDRRVVEDVPPDDRYENGYDPSRYYRPGQERVLATSDRVYAGNDGRYYCKRSDGTTGLIVGGAAGGILGNVIDGGRNRVAGTLIGGALGALAGKSIDQNSGSGYTCRWA